MSTQADTSISNINLALTFDRLYWSRKFRISERELADAIAAVGSRAENVRRHLVGSDSPSQPQVAATSS